MCIQLSTIGMHQCLNLLGAKHIYKGLLAISLRGGVNTVGGCQSLMQRHYGKLVCKNEKIWTLAGATRRRRPLDLPMSVEYICCHAIGDLV